MMNQRTKTTLPQTLQSPRAKLVYLYLSTHDGATVGELQAALDMKKLSLYSILRTLEGYDLVAKRTERYELQ